MSSTHFPQTEWERLPVDPDLERDFGYDIDEWEAVRARDDGNDGHVMFLPSDPELLKEDAFIVADADSVCNVVDRT